MTEKERIKHEKTLEQLKSMDYHTFIGVIDNMFQLIVDHVSNQEAGRPTLLAIIRELRDRFYFYEKHQLELLQHISRFLSVPELAPQQSGEICDGEIGYLREICVHLSKSGVLEELPSPIGSHGFDCGGRHWQIIHPDKRKEKP